jgi:hypothetical protein
MSTDKITDSQDRAILTHLLDGGTITSLQARRKFGTVALNSRISTIRNKMQIPVADKWITVKTRYGYKRVKEYSINPNI